MMCDCVKCYSTPCECGYDYRHRTKDERLTLAAAALGIPKQVLAESVWGKVPDVHPMKDSL